MNIRTFTLLLAFSSFASQSGFSQCSTGGGGGGKCGTEPVIKFNGLIYAEVGDEGTIEGTMTVGSETANTPTPEAGVYLVVLATSS